MKYLLSTTYLLLCCLTLSAQDCEGKRYYERVFSEIKVTKNIVYGQVDPFDETGDPSKEDIELDFYEPVGDNLTKRPLVVMVYGGAFITGAKEDCDIVAWSDSLAHQGYAVAAIRYRLNFSPAYEDSAVRAVYRALQDMRAAIRFLLEDPNNQSFRIDRDLIFCGGQSAGAITCQHTAYLDKESERPPATYGAGGVSTGGLVIHPHDLDDLGCLDCSGNDYVQDFTIKGILAMWGAVYRLNYLEVSQNIPMLMVHGTDDGIVPYCTGRPFGLLTLPEVHGSKVIAADMTAKGIQNELYAYEGDDTHTVYGDPHKGEENVPFPNEHWEDIYNVSQRFLTRIMAFDSPIPIGPTNVQGTDGTATYSVPASSNNYCWTVTNGVILSDNGNEITVQWDMSKFSGTVAVEEMNDIDFRGNPGVLQIGVNADALALELLDFVAETKQAEIALQWTTLEEENHAHFVVEKSVDGYSFAALTTVAAQAKNGARTHYDYVDVKPSSGTNYYRLRLVDQAGRLAYSPVVSVDFRLQDWMVERWIAQNGEIQIQINSPRATPLQIELFNLRGQRLRYVSEWLQLGANSAKISLRDLPRAAYILRLTDGQRSWTHKLVY
ncbi:MAG: T9SS type A sorting domain-containing protein [Bacteroidota bacterium]